MKSWFFRNWFRVIVLTSSKWNNSQSFYSLTIVFFTKDKTIVDLWRGHVRTGKDWTTKLVYEFAIFKIAHQKTIFMISRLVIIFTFESKFNRPRLLDLCGAQLFSMTISCVIMPTGCWFFLEMFSEVGVLSYRHVLRRLVVVVVRLIIDLC